LVEVFFSIIERQALRRGDFAEDFPRVDNPFGIAGFTTMLKGVASLGGVLLVAGVLGALASLAVRFTRARGLEASSSSGRA
jgi:hypothetical protein